MAQTWTQEQLIQLRDNLNNYFSDEELRDLCFSLRACQGLERLDYDSLPAQGKAAKARELVAYVGRHNCIPALAKKCRELRPNVDWGPADDVSEVLQSGSGRMDKSPQSLSGVAPTSEPSSRRQAKRPLGQSPQVSRAPSRRSKPKKPPQFSWPWKEISAIVVAAIGVVAIYVQYYLPHQASITATQTAEARLTQVALSATPTATSTPSPTPTSTPTPTPTSTPTLLVTTTIRLDALAVPEGWMSGDQANPTKYISVTTLFEGCHAGPGCMRWTFKPGGVWANVLWWPPGCRLDTLNTCGIDLLAQGGFSAIDRLTFWARGDKGGEIIEFKIGGGAALPKSARSRKATLESDWRQYEIDLTGLDLTNASGLFIWAAADAENPTGAVFYLDSILFEGYRR